MSQVNYAAMSDAELRQYFLRHREDKMAIRAYLDRLSERPRRIITTHIPHFKLKYKEITS
jgi:hypothetical protein